MTPFDCLRLVVAQALLSVERVVLIPRRAAERISTIAHERTAAASVALREAALAVSPDVPCSVCARPTTAITRDAKGRCFVCMIEIGCVEEVEES